MSANGIKSGSTDRESTERQVTEHLVDFQYSSKFWNTAFVVYFTNQLSLIAPNHNKS